MKNIITVLLTTAILSIWTAVPASSDEISDYIADVLNSQYNGMRQKAKGDKKKLARLAKIRSVALKRIHKIEGMEARPIAVSALEKMKKVVK